MQWRQWQFCAAHGVPERAKRGAAKPSPSERWQDQGRLQCNRNASVRMLADISG